METAMSSEVAEIGPRGIGGWLLLAIIGLAMTSLLVLGNVVVDLRDIGAAGWGAFYEASPALASFSAVTSASGVIVVAYAIYCLWLIFSFDPRVPRAMTAFYLAMAVVVTLKAVGLLYFSNSLGDPGLVDNEPRDAIRAWLTCAIWIPYFRVSKRVANTFAREAG